MDRVRNMGFYDFSVMDGKGNEFSLKDYQGKVVMVINSATACGFTPQYEDKENPDIKWNFTKFIIDRDGRVAARFEPTIKMSEVEKLVESLL